MNKKGFTLIELLAVIVILAIISLITIPVITNVIEKARIGALESSVRGLIESADMYYANNILDGNKTDEVTFLFEDGKQISEQKLSYKGDIPNGKLILHPNGKVAVCIDNGEHYAYKNKDTDEIISGEGSCLYDGTTGDFSSNSSINNLSGQTVVATNISKSEDGMSAVIDVPEEGYYDETSKISVSLEEINELVFDEKQTIGTINSNSYTEAVVGAYYHITIIMTGEVPESEYHTIYNPTGAEVVSGISKSGIGGSHDSYTHLGAVVKATSTTITFNPSVLYGNYMWITKITK